MSLTWDTYRGQETAYRVLVWIPGGNRPLRRPRHKWILKWIFKWNGEAKAELLRPTIKMAGVC
jgi:hypothetical protein